MSVFILTYLGTNIATFKTRELAEAAILTLDFLYPDEVKIQEFAVWDSIDKWTEEANRVAQPTLFS